MAIWDKVIAVAEAEVGYHEKATWADLDDPKANPGDQNYTKYSRDLAKHNYYNSSKKGVMWCDIFVDWCFATAYGYTTGREMLYQPLRSDGAGCGCSRKYFSEHKALSDTPGPGDQVFFWGSSDPTSVSHTGLVVRISGGRVYTVEGNSSNQVRKHSYPLNYARFAGFGRPDWSLVQDKEENPMESYFVTSTDGNTVRLREMPSKESKVVCKLKVGTEVRAEAPVNGWQEVHYGDVAGYMMQQFLKPAESVPDQPVSTPTDLGGGQGGVFVKTLTMQEYNALCEARDILISIVGVG